MIRVGVLWIPLEIKLRPRRAKRAGIGEYNAPGKLNGGAGLALREGGSGQPIQLHKEIVTWRHAYSMARDQL